jgi:hypothetical protein
VEGTYEQLPKGLGGGIALLVLVVKVVISLPAYGDDLRPAAALVEVDPLRELDRLGFLLHAHTRWEETIS